MDLKNIGIFREAGDYSRIVGKFDRGDILLPGVVVDNLDIEVSKLLHPIFDILWQSAGLNGSPNYRDGVWGL